MTRTFEGSPAFPAGARVALGNPQLRRNLANATHTIRAKRDRVVGELDTWEDLRLAGEAIKTEALGDLDRLLERFEANVVAAGGHVHWARTAAEANEIVVGLVKAEGVDEVVKVKSMTTAETGLNPALEAAGITAYETDLAELIVQLGDDLPSHIVVPAIHRSRDEIRATFLDHMGQWGRPAPGDLSNDPTALAGTARLHLRERFLRAQVGISGANFLVAETGSVAVVESEGNGRMCLTLPRTLITVAGIDKVIPRWEDLDAFFQLLPRSATGERMNPYNSVWTGVTPGDGPQTFHVVLVDNGRSHALADTVGRQALRCIRCAACLNVCPVYERVGGHAYGSVYPGPIGAVLTPQLDHVAGDDVAASLPYASTLCGACFDACPVRIDIPRLLVHLRGEVVDAARRPLPVTEEQAAMRAASWVLARPGRLAAVARVGALLGRPLAGRHIRLPGWLAGWTTSRTLPLPSEPSFADWWDASHPDLGAAAPRSRVRRARRVRRVGMRQRLALRRRTGGRAIGLQAAAAPVAPVATSGTGPAAREEILGRLGSVLGASRAAVAVPRAYRRTPGPRPDDLVELFASRVDDYQATVTRVPAADLPATIAEVLARRGCGRVVVPDDLPQEWTLGATATVIVDNPALSIDQLDAVDSVITGCAVAIAETGTVVLDAGARQGRRALTLVPDHHVLVVREDQVVGGVHDAMGRIRPTGAQTWISGPSATSDIELKRVEGVHGPRKLDVLIVSV